jgi:ankyrin repeat protein
MVLSSDQIASGIKDTFKLDTYIETMKFNPLHKIIAGLAHADSATFADLIKLEPALVNGNDALGFTPLHFAVFKKNRPAVRHLLDAGADVDASSCIKELTPFSAAAMGARDDIIMNHFETKYPKHDPRIC